ncbi:MAG: hypothetical protein AAB348_01445 [Patescibacteria group bacterium]
MEKNGAPATPDYPIPKWAQPFLIKTSVVLVDGKRYVYAILRQEAEPAIPGFVGWPDCTFLFISDKVPVRFRRHFLAHEVRERDKLAGQPGRCLAALQLELAGIPAEIREAYLPYRLAFFGALLLYYRQKPPDDPTLVAELTASYEHLKKLVMGR